MNGEYLVQGSLAMTRGSVLRIEDGADLLMYVCEGSVWLTQEGERRDRYIGTGNRFQLDRDGVTVVCAMQRSVVTLTAPEPELFARRIALVKAGAASPIELYSAARSQASLGARVRRCWAQLFAPRARPTTASL